MSRQQLIDISEKAFNWASSHSKDPAQLSLCVAEDVAWLTPLPGTTPDFAGILAYQQTNTSGSSDFKMTLRNVIVDEIESRVVHFMEITGTHDGEWMGIPATGKPFHVYGFAVNKIDLARGLIVEIAIVVQDLLLLQQVGIIPAKPSG